MASAATSESPVAKVAPVTDPDELVALLARLVEDASDALATERALAGSVRLAILPLAERARLAAPLVKRARKQAMDDFSGPFSGQAIRADLGWLALTWATGELPPASTAEAAGWHSPGQDTPWQSRRPAMLSAILSTRIGEACTLIAARPGQGAAGREARLLAEPEFADGTITPGELAAREALWAAAGLASPRYDREVAWLRAAPAADEALELEPFVASPTARNLEVPRQRSRLSGAATGVRARLARVPEPRSAPSCWPLLTRLEHDSVDDRQFAVQRTGVRLDEMVAAWPALCPRDPELAAAHLLSPLSDALGKGRNAGTTALRGLAGLGGPFGKIGHLALVTGLAAEAVDVRIAAGEAWTQIAATRRLDPALAAEAIEFGVTSGALRLSRVADGLGYPTGADPGASCVARACVLATSAMLASGTRPAGLHRLLELAASASAACGVAPELPARVAGLAAGRPTSKLAEAARRLRDLAAGQ
jgi:hypothetical protein